ncbi:MAG: lipopolysaccharide heptosyltransferase II [Planctomycetaceae bacterium]|jgi:heptosyltransferase-2|nr:lipopolysaccharide heptosyltransferase II [Planctomycetaceae bacterium]
MIQKSKKICVFLPNWLGDAVMATPAIRTLYEQLNNTSALTALGRPHILELFDGNPWFDHYIPFQIKNATPEQSQHNIIQQLKHEQFDIALLFPNSLRSAFIAWLGNIVQRIGYAQWGRSLFLSPSVKTPPDDISLIDYYFNLVNVVTGKNVPEDPTIRYRLELYTTPEEEKLGDDIWNNLGLRCPEKVLILNVGSANSIARNWSQDYTVELSQRIVDQLDFDVLINCGPAETKTVKEIVTLTKRKRVFSLADQPLNIHTGKICLKRAKLTVSTDSGPLHIASAFGKPTLVLLGPTSETYIANPYINRYVLTQHLPCSPCYAKKKCPQKHHRCMKEITPQLVFEKIQQLIVNQ